MNDHDLDTLDAETGSDAAFLPLATVALRILPALAGATPDASPADLVADAFTLAEAFLAEAERRLWESRYSIATNGLGQPAAVQRSGESADRPRR